MKHILWGLALISFIGCKSYTPFTQNLYSDLEMSEQELKSVQFYLSKDIELFRALESNESAVQNGKIKLKKGRRVEELLFKKGTPGVLVFLPKQDRFAVSFDSDSDKYLMFGPNKKLNSQYALLAKSWENKIGKITYGDKVYETSTRSALSTLMVDLSNIRKTSVKRKTAKGRKV